MRDINLETILKRVPTTPVTKTAAEKNPKNDDVAEARKGVEAAVAEAKKDEKPKNEKEASTKPVSEKVAAVEKIANELLDADTDSMMKLAECMGARFEEGRLAAATLHAQTAQALEAQNHMPKTAEEAQAAGYMDGVNCLGAVVDAADQGYAKVMNGIQKLASDVYARGYYQTDLLIKKAQEKAKVSNK